MEADLLGAFRLGTGTRSADSASERPRALAFALDLGTGITSAMISAAAAAAPIVGTGVAAALRALDALARGGGLYWGTTSSSSMGPAGTGVAPLLLDLAGARGLGVVALGALAPLGFPRPKG